MRKKFTKLLLSAAAAVAAGLLASSCLVVVEAENGAEIRYTWESSQQANIISIAASYRDVADWYYTVWNAYYPGVPEEISHFPKYDGSDRIPDNIYSSTIKSTRYKGVYNPISRGSYTAICTVYDPDFGDTYDIVANYDIEEYYFLTGETTYYELAFDVGLFLSGNSRPDMLWEFEEYDNRNKAPILRKASAPDPVVKVIEGNNVTYIVLRRPAKS